MIHQEINYYAIPGVAPSYYQYISESALKYGITIDQLKLKTRKEPIAEARMYAMYLIRLNTKLTVNQIGDKYNKNHASVTHAKKTIQNRIDTNQLLC